MVIFMSYYQNFGIVLGNPLWRVYLRWAYKTCGADLEKIGFKPNFSKKDFTALLCGVGNENTADEFIKFVIAKNLKGKIIIIDIADKQIDAVNRLVKDKYSNINIKVKQIDALKLNTFLEKNSVDWIETDGFPEYFNHVSLIKLLSVWKTILVKNGFITFRDCVTEGFLEHLADRFRIWIAKVWLGITVYSHSKKEMKTLFDSFRFKYIEGLTLLPTFRRYSLVNN